MVLDLRNDYEWDAGHFEGAERPLEEEFVETPVGECHECRPCSFDCSSRNWNRIVLYGNGQSSGGNGRGGRIGSWLRPHILMFDLRCGFEASAGRAHVTYNSKVQATCADSCR